MAPGFGSRVCAVVPAVLIRFSRILLIAAGSSMQAMTSERVMEYYIFTAVVDLLQRGIQSLRRFLYVSRIPPDKAAEIFGFEKLTGKLLWCWGRCLWVR